MSMYTDWADGHFDSNPWDDLEIDEPRLWIDEYESDAMVEERQWDGRNVLWGVDPWEGDVLTEPPF
jgi:hypothetical protein